MKKEKEEKKRGRINHFKRRTRLATLAKFKTNMKTMATTIVKSAAFKAWNTMRKSKQKS